MKTTQYTTRVIEPSDGYTLTQSAEVAINERILSKKIYLAVNDDPSNYKEITDAEAEVIRKAQNDVVGGE